MKSLWSSIKLYQRREAESRRMVAWLCSYKDGDELRFDLRHGYIPDEVLIILERRRKEGNP